MRFPTWRLVVTGGAIVVLLAFGIGFVAASTAGAPVDNSAALPASTDAPTASGDPDHHHGSGFRKFLDAHAGRLGFAKRVVHVTATFTDKDGKLVTIQIDHGTVQSIGTGNLVISEAGGTTVTVSTDTDTKVWLGHDAGKLSDLKAGDTVFVQSRVDGSTLAKRILKVPATAADTGG